MLAPAHLRLASLAAAAGMASVCFAQSSVPATGQPAATPPATTPVPAPKEPDAKTAKPIWDVAKAPGTAVEAAIDTDEGTWMSVDVSPDGKTITFDLLGDIYTMPFTGGEATCVAGGSAWDMQPAFSPDGTQIAFVSDRTGEGGKGGDNIWVMKTDGSQPRQVTKESFRLLSQPTWTRDGQSIVARKHFTSRRSLGAGEMWMYHASGMFDGLQMTVKPTEQKDVGEPALSPDGKYLYYSLDASPGSSFEYDKDSNRGIYAVDRLDLAKGETERLIGGPGGACRPVPSPDGKSIAFVRRVRFDTVLFVMDLASGKARPVYDKLERDLQETWAIHGVYPHLAWTPDSSTIVFWAHGKIRKVNVASGKADVIPFHVKGSRAVHEPVRFPQDVAPAEFDVKMLQSVSVSPKGDKVAFQALGRVYVKDLAGTAAPKPLTTQSKDFEFFPSWSRDGSKIAYVSWNDEALGAVRVIDAAGGVEGAAITTEPGHYQEPVFSPDGKAVVFGKVSGGYLTTPLWSYEPGVYWAPAANATAAEKVKPKLLTKKGTHPHFGASSDRVFLETREGGKDSDKASLFSIGMDGKDERTHYTSDWATEFEVSPDGRWLAFAERFNAYITPFVNTGREVAVAPKGSNLPIARVTKESGANLHWSGDSRTLHWSLGAELFSRSLKDSFAFVAGAPEKLPEPAATGVNIGFKAKSDSPTGVSAFVGARVLTMGDTTEGGKTVRGGKVIENATVVVEGNRILAVGPAAEVKVPAGATVYDASGKTIMPGLIDVHAHGGQGENGFTPQHNWGQLANLAFGVTTIHDPSNDTQAIFAASELAKAGLVLQPRTFSTGTILYGAAGAYRTEIDSLDDALFALKRMQAVGAFSVKSYNQPRRDQRQQIIEAARQLKMMVVPEGGALFHHNMTMIADGHTSIEHTIPVPDVYKDVLEFWHASTIGYTPTLGVAYGGLGGENYWYAKTKVWENARLMTFVPRFIVDPKARRHENAPDNEWNHINQAKICKKLVDNGNRVTLGAHGQLAGLAAHWELWMFVQGGMTPLEAIRAGTIDGAWYVGLDKDLGSIEPGKLADFLVLDKNPLENIRNSEEIANVVLNGRVYDARTLARLGSDPKPRPKLFFEDLQGGIAGNAAGLMHMHAGCAGCGRIEGDEEPARAAYR